VIDYKETCDKIYKATRTDVVIVFAVRGEVYFFKNNDKRCDVMLKDFPNSLVGVYDQRCSLKYIQEDIL